MTATKIQGTTNIVIQSLSISKGADNRSRTVLMSKHRLNENARDWSNKSRSYIEMT